ncbi:hypothetical protein GPJ56_005736 [Histomonas meleagridis]|uniref:uncharacterized protein n=1 Tax=Histomonas meleagridis TaxID=135588 RepID=UPI00355A8FA1|nr:hypothetical protein GPJ56_005736 [Histomonas meleagridis]KAH0803328.1 hypothetical protein GO595_003672 [Histomonas meleagridis]
MSALLGKENEIFEILSLMVSPDPNISNNSSNLFIAISFIHPDLIIQNLDQIQLIILSLCSSPDPLWGTISSIFFGLSNAINLRTQSLPACFLKLIEISYDVTKVSLSTATDPQCFYPHLCILTETIINCYDSSFEITKDIFIAITDHCMLGFTSYSPLIQVLIDKFQQIVTIAQDLDPNDLSKISNPLLSHDKTVAHFYITLWSNLMIKMIDNPIAVQALRRQATGLIYHSRKHEPYQEAAKFLLDITRSSSDDRPRLQKGSRSIAERVLNELKSYRKRTKQTEFKSNHNQKHQKSLTQFTVHKAQVAVNTHKGHGKLSPKNWKENLELRLVEEAGILFWSKAENMLHKGVAVQCSDIENLSLIRESQTECEKENVIKVQMNSKVCYFLAFASYQMANQWQNLIKQARFIGTK